MVACYIHCDYIIYNIAVILSRTKLPLPHTTQALMHAMGNHRDEHLTKFHEYFVNASDKDLMHSYIDSVARVRL